MNNRPLLLVILDGFGYSEQAENNAILAAQTPHLNKLWDSYPRTLIGGSGTAVGLPDDQIGNSEVGHMNIGAGRIVPQDFTRITQAIADGSFDQNPTLLDGLNKAHSRGRAVHLLGLLSPGGVHSHLDHIEAMVKLAAKQGIEKLFIHAFLDGRDTPPQSALQSIHRLEKCCQGVNTGKIASMVGRYYAMDRDNRWDRIESAYQLLLNHAPYGADTAEEALTMAYGRGETDEFVKPTAIRSTQGSIESGDTVILMNFRADRMREITRALTESDFTEFDRPGGQFALEVISMIEYATDIQTKIAFPPIDMSNTLGQIVSNQQLKQLRIAETEKYAHVTFFLNGGREEPFPGEDRQLIPSPKVATYDLQPEMSADALTESLAKAIVSERYDLIVCNYANADMVGHSGDFKATVKAIEVIDHCIGQLERILKQVGGEMVITADHGNAEQMYCQNNQQPHTAHTVNPVPFIYIGRHATIPTEKGCLADIAPTVLSIMGITQPKEMTGKSLVQIEP